MSNIKTLKGSLPWTDKNEWAWPVSDTRMNSYFTRGTGDLDTAIPMILPHLPERRTCIQAGGCLGIWPLRLAQFFDNVFTFEPEPTNFECLEINTAHLENVHATHAALGSAQGTAQMRLSRGEVGNSGAFYTVPGGDIDVIAIDEIGLEHVDLIYLDIEGRESDALRGAADTIRRCQPVIGVEDKGLHVGRSGKSAVGLLCNEFGYTVLGRPFKLDIILLPPE